MRWRWPWRRERVRQRVLNPGGDAVLVNDTSKLAGDELLDLGGGKFVRLADLFGLPDEVPIVGEDGR